jgi:hypothetical protein
VKAISEPSGDHAGASLPVNQATVGVARAETTPRRSAAAPETIRKARRVARG